MDLIDKIIHVFSIKNMTIAFLIICGLLIFRYFVKMGENEFREEILNDRCIVTGKITDYVDVGDAGCYIVYQFEYNREIYEGNQNPQYSHIRYFINKKFPVIFSCKNPSLNNMLILPKNFEFFNMEFPDSLDWVKQYEEW